MDIAFLSPEVFGNGRCCMMLVELHEHTVKECYIAAAAPQMLDPS